MKKFRLALPSHPEKGQSIVLIALVFIGLLAFIGLTVDMGILFVGYGNLRRAVDNSALAAATQMRENYTLDQLKDSAAQFLRLNNVDVSPSTVDVDLCDLTASPVDAELCPTDRRKLVRVTATVPVKFSFLPVIGFYETDITASAIAEAASMDVVLVIDISESMANNSASANDKDPINCNANGTCEPFNAVKDAAADTFANYILNKPAGEEEDRLAIVVFSNGWQDHNYYYQPGYAANLTIPTTGTGVVCPYGEFDAFGRCTNPWTSDYNVAWDLIQNLKVYEREPCPMPWEEADVTGSCSEYDTAIPPNYVAARCPYAQDVNTFRNQLDSSICQTTNIGGGLQLGASLYGMDMRKDALWLLILLTDGAANATEVNHDSDPEYLAADNVTVLQSIKQSLPIGFCPPGVAVNNGCRDDNALGRHDDTSANYDADDYARDMADLVSCDPKDPEAACSRSGQGAVMFAIGLGPTVVTSPLDGSGVAYGDTLLRYVGAVGDDGDPATDPCSSVTYPGSDYNCGNYYFSSTGTGLTSVFKQIASRVFTRLTK